MDTSIPLPTTEKIKITGEMVQELENQRFEEHRVLLNNYYRTAYYDQLDYIVHKINHTCPIVSASWLMFHIETESGFIIPDYTKVYRGFPCMLTIFPEKDCSSYIILSGFKSDVGSELLFNQLRKLNAVSFEIEITKRIFEQVENFYVSPYFWESIK